MALQVFVEDGKPREFFLIGLTPAKFDSYVEKIELLGGRVNQKTTKGIIILTSTVDVEDTPRYDIKYVDDCLRKGKLLDLSHYRLDVPRSFRGEAVNDSPKFGTNEEEDFPTPLASSSIQDAASSNLTARMGLHSAENSLESTEEVEKSVSKKVKSSPTCHRSSPPETEDPGSCNSNDTIIIRPAEKRTKVADRSNSAITTADRTLNVSDEELKLLKALSQQLEGVNRSYGDALSTNTNKRGNSEQGSPGTNEILLLSADESSRALRTKIEKAPPQQQTVTSSSQASKSIDDEVIIVESDSSQAKSPPELVTLDTSDDELQFLPQSQANTLKNVEPLPHCSSSNLNSSFRSHLSSRNNSMVSLPSNTGDKKRSIESSDTHQSSVASTSKRNGIAQRPKAAVHYMGMTFVEANPPTSESESDDDSDSPPSRRVNGAGTVNRHRLRANRRFIAKPKGGDVNRSPLSPVSASAPRQDNAGSVHRSPLLPREASPPSLHIRHVNRSPSLVGRCPPKENIARNVNRSPSQAGPSHERRRRRVIYSSDSDDAATVEPPARRREPRENSNNSPRIHSSGSDASVADEPPARKREERGNGNDRARILPKRMGDSDDDEVPENAWQVKPPTKEEREDFSWMFSRNADWRSNICDLEERLSRKQDHLVNKAFTHWEQLGMLWYLIKNNSVDLAKTRAIWERMNENGYLRHRTPTALRLYFSRLRAKGLDRFRMPLKIRALFGGVKDK